ncbi:MAG TPA: folate-binding protein [Bauldia sp.]|nr:folate-binding protein [Bauldia sp.]
MSNGRIAELPSRGVVAVSGSDAAAFLDNLFTTDVSKAGRENAVYGGLLTPQGKILFDFIVFSDGSRYLVDISRALVPDFVKRLGFYKLRAKVEIVDLTGERIIVAAWGGEGAPVLDGPVAPDPRLAALGYRAVVPPGADMAPDYTEATESDYRAHCIALGVPEGGIDFTYGDAFPHDAAMDQLHGVDFRKGCYVGQEVVSRMEHRGTARRRPVLARAATTLPAAGSPVTAGDMPVGAIGSASGNLGVALVRLDRAREAMDAGVPLMAAGAPVELAIPAWANFDWPKAAQPANEEPVTRQ